MRHVRVYVNMELRIQVTKYKLQNTSYKIQVTKYKLRL